MSEIINFILHVDSYLLELTQNYGVWIYAILFAIVFAETGLVVTPFLPGDEKRAQCISSATSSDGSCAS